MPDPSDTTTPSPPLRPLGSTADPIPTAPRSHPRRSSHDSLAPAPLRGPHNPRTPRPSLLSPAAMAAAIFPPQGTPGRGAGLRGRRARRGRGQREPARRRRVENSIGRGRGAGEAPPHDPARQGGKGGGFPGPPRVMQRGDQPREAVQHPPPPGPSCSVRSAGAPRAPWNRCRVCFVAPPVQCPSVPPMDPFLTPPRCSHRAAQLGSAQLSLAWLGSAQLSSAQLSSARSHLLAVLPGTVDLGQEEALLHRTAG